MRLKEKLAREFIDQCLEDQHRTWTSYDAFLAGFETARELIAFISDDSKTILKIGEEEQKD